MFKHTTNSVIMVRPAGFYANPDTADDNVYQNSSDESLESIQAKALAEFDNVVELLKKEGIDVNVIQDVKEPSTPDCIFPNNWFSSHEGDTLVIYSMFSQARRYEMEKFKRQVEEILLRKNDNRLLSVLDYSYATKRNIFLEGTGAMVIDRKNKVAYCSVSKRADKELFYHFCKDTGHTPVTFSAMQDDQPIYHTNVLMGIGEELTLICLDTIVDENERKMVKESLENGGNTIVELSLDQVKNFLGNNIELKAKEGKNILAISTTAYNSLCAEQIKIIEEKLKIFHAPIDTIEYYGGGSMRCMIAEIFV